MALSRRPITTVTLDMGYTLVNLKQRFNSELVELATSAGFSVTLEAVQRAVSEYWDQQAGIDADRTWFPTPENDDASSLDIDRQICMSLGIHDPEIHWEANRRSRAIFEDPTSYTIFPEVPDALRELRGRVSTLGIVSNWGWWLPELCLELGLASSFDFIITSARVGAAKPHPAIFQAALDRSGSRPGETLHAGDSLRADVHGAQAAGIRAVLLDRSGQAQAPGVDVIPSLTGLLDLL